MNETGRPPAPRLLAVADDIEPRELALEGDAYTLGRSAACDVVAPRPTVSRLHARILRDGPRYVLHDAGSANGTFVNGVRLLAPRMLVDRDRLGLGEVVAVLAFADVDPTVVPTSRLRYDDRAIRFFLGEEPLDLTPTELRFLRFLWDCAGSVCTREQCAAAVWGPDYPPGADADTLDRLASNLRAKLRRADPEANVLRTRPGLGYELVP